MSRGHSLEITRTRMTRHEIEFVVEASGFDRGTPLRGVRVGSVTVSRDSRNYLFAPEGPWEKHEFPDGALLSTVPMLETDDEKNEDFTNTEHPPTLSKWFMSALRRALAEALRGPNPKQRVLRVI